MTLAYAGCRLSEALALTADRVDLAAGVLVFESLKKRRTGIYRSVPVPPALLEALDLVHGIREAQARRGKGRSERLWPCSRMTGWRAVHAAMAAAELDGPHASPKGLRHGFGVAAVSAGIPLNLVQKWLGHAHHHHSHLCQRRRRRGKRHRSQDVGVEAFIENDAVLLEGRLARRDDDRFRAKSGLGDAAMSTTTTTDLAEHVIAMLRAHEAEPRRHPSSVPVRLRCPGGYRGRQRC
jgi:integrase/recombinase XerD